MTRFGRNAILSVAILCAAPGALYAQQATNTGPDIRYVCEVEYFGQIDIAVWTKQGVCRRDSQGKSREVRCSVSDKSVRLALVSGVEQIDRDTERFEGRVVVNQRPAPYKGLCRSLKQKPQS